MESPAFAGLNEEQRQAVAAVRGPVCILAGAGSGKTTTITRRIAHQVGSGVFEPGQVLAVTFTDKAAKEMGSRLGSLGVSGVRVRTFHAEALAQYRFLTGSDAQILDSKAQLLAPLAQRLPPPHKFVPVRDIATEIEWARNRRIGPERYPSAIEGRLPPIPVEYMAGLYGSYERRKAERGLMDFEDLLERCLQLLEGAGAAAATVRRRYRAFSVDEYQDVNQLQQSLLEAWVGDRDDLCVVGDDYQSIFGFTGATPRYLVEFPRRYPHCRVVKLEANYRSTPEVLAVANRLAARFGPQPRQLRAAGQAPDAPPPMLLSFATGDDELSWIVAELSRLHAEGIGWEEMAVLYRINGRSEPLEEALAKASIPYQVAGAAFLRRPAARSVLASLRRGVPAGRAGSLVAAVEAAVRRVGYRPGDDEATGEEATRQADLARLVALAGEYEASGGGNGLAGFVADLQRRFASEESGRGVQISTYHRAKGKEFDAVFLPRLEDRELPFGLATSPEEQEEERRLLYVGITRARRHLAISWAAARTDSRWRVAPSRFLDELRPPGPAVAVPPKPVERRSRQRADGDDSPLLAALKEWRREEARQRELPAYIIFHDKTLAAIAEARPATKVALGHVAGVGPAKISSYGDAVLALVAAAGARRDETLHPPAGRA
ncbi:MAG TPA: ATP-dependent DNA helicase UvrD2 [Actinomycetota bacterium]|nr:ATP-dependent DNA helicase UvrD2 [Actinomycetota bacterium]